MPDSDIQIETIPYKTILRNLAIFGLVTLLLGEFLFRKRYAKPLIIAIQKQLVLHPTLGFTWKPHISSADEITFEDQDAETYPLSTNQWGFINTPDAIKALETDRSADIVGLGDSFLEHCAHVLTSFFASRNLSYYNFAMHRQSPPQYTDILETLALPLKPDWVVYTIFENDFQEITDYLNWTRSDLDWFAFHSGTWCGTPIAQSSVGQFRDNYLRGYSALYNVIQSKLLGNSLSVDGPPAGSAALITQEVVDAHNVSIESGVSFVVMFIPARGSVLDEPSLESDAYDDLILELDERQIDSIDLRNVFRNHPDPPSLYYKINGHWNPKGITIAAESLISHFETHPNQPEPDQTP